MKVNSEQSVHLAGFNLVAHRHVCALFHNQDQEDKMLVPFLKEGLDRGEKAFCVLDPQVRMHLLQKLSDVGVEITLAEERSQLEVKEWERTIVRGGRLDQNTLLELIEEVLRQGREQGFPLTRFVARMDWALDYGLRINDLVEFEARVNHLLEKFPDPVICVYCLAKFNTGAVLDILRIHPVVVIGDLVAENPFFVPPDVFLKELSERDGGK
jgi:hypothetical protein